MVALQRYGFVATAKLINLDFDQAGGKHIVLPLDHFWIEGPNGSHLCLVLLVLGPRVPVIWTAFSRFPDPDKSSRSIALQVATGLQFLHRNGICLGDFRPSNILLRLSDLDSLTEEQIATEFREPLKDPVLTMSGEIPGPSAPKYTVKPITLEDLDARHFTDQACVIDFGESYDLSSPPEGLGIPSTYCSPELIFDSSVGVASYIWALSCTLYEIRSVSNLFESSSGDDDEILLQMVKLLGRLPDPWWASWDPRNRWFNEDSTPRIDPETGKAFVNCFTIPELLSDGVHFTITATQQPVDIVVPRHEREILADLLLQMLKYDPQSRATVESVLEHPWFKL